MISLLLFASLPKADAFCGTYVGGAGSEFFNEYSQVAIVRNGTRTALTVVNDVQGSFDSFALVIPVPEVLQEEDVHVLEPDVFDRLDAYSQPRLVSYECEDFVVHDSGNWALNDASEEGGWADTGGVTIEAQYVVGEYEIVVLSATQSNSLLTWLNDNEYQVPAQAEELLQEYISSGSYFLAAKVSADAGIQSGDSLSPLQFNYDSGAFQIPIRIGTLNSKSEQDLVVYAINGYDNGMAGISNFREMEIEDECMWDSEGEEFGQFVSSNFTDAYESEESAGWLLEYAWGGGNCDPCAGSPPDQADLVSLGMDEETVHYGNYYFTRLHMRYTPQQVEEELVLYHTNIAEQSQIRYIEYKEELEDRFPVCGIGMADNPGSCDEDGSGASGDDDLSSGDIREAGCGGGCDSSGGMLAGLWLLAAGLVSRRRQGGAQ
jgi:hypothetical protein